MMYEKDRCISPFHKFKDIECNRKIKRNIKAYTQYTEIWICINAKKY